LLGKTAVEEAVFVPRFVTIGYGDRAGYDRTDPSVRDAAHQHDERLLAQGASVEASMTPCAVAHGVVEVWPLQSTP
jgi:hypothetical protein